MEVAPMTDELDELDRRALTQYLTVLPEHGPAKDAFGLYVVMSESGREYLVDAYEGACECPDHQYRNRQCKHLRRVEYATGERPVPNEVDVDDQLGLHVQRAITDGGRQ